MAPNGLRNPRGGGIVAGRHACAECNKTGHGGGATGGTRLLGPAARFVSRRDAVMPEIRPEYLEGKKVGAITGSSHEAYLKAMFTDAELHSYQSDDALRLGLRRGEVDFIFGDAISLAFWINGTDSDGCCAFSGGPFVESRYFGEGIGIAVRKGNDFLRQALNWARFPVLGKV